jgi:hypothetical protein
MNDLNGYCGSPSFEQIGQPRPHKYIRPFVGHTVTDGDMTVITSSTAWDGGHPQLTMAIIKDGHLLTLTPIQVASLSTLLRKAEEAHLLARGAQKGAEKLKDGDDAAL